MAEPSRKAPSGPRRKGRELALVTLYQAEFRPDWSQEEKEAFLRGEAAPAAAIEFARQLVAGVEASKTKLDELIATACPGWKLNRIGCIELSILRLGCYELTECHDVPAAVAIDEAVELAKLYGTAESGAFVNGVLDMIRKHCAHSRDVPSKSHRETESRAGQDAQ